MNIYERNAGIKAIIDQNLGKICQSEQTAKNYFYEKIGTHNKDGSLCRQFGGEYTDTDHPVHCGKL